jgi:hypothetical protein
VNDLSTAGDNPAKNKLREVDRVCIASAIIHEKKFSLYWVEKLKAELHSRKYSQKTISSCMDPDGVYEM